MSALDIEALLREVSAEAPSGQNLEGDGAFLEMEQLAKGKPERQYGGTIIPAEEPDWPGVKRKAVELFSRTKDLRVAAQLTQALLRAEGLAGLDDGLSVLQGLIEKYWESVHPQLDPEDDNDPTQRINIIAFLSDAATILRWAREATLLSSRSFGKFSVRDVLIGTGTIPAPSGATAPEASVIEGAFADSSLGDLQSISDRIGHSIEAIERIEALLNEKVGAANSADLSPLAGLLKSGRQVVGARLSRRKEASASAQPVQAAATAPEAARPSASVRPDAVGSRDDVVRILERVCAYFYEHEPSSPVPLLLERARRLVSMSFIEIVRDLAPDALAQVELFRRAKTEIDNEGKGGDDTGAARGGIPSGERRRSTPPVSVPDRNEAVRALDLASSYLIEREPSSPVPLLLGRAKRLIAKSFIDIVRDLAPDAVERIQLIGGTQTVFDETRRNG